MSDRPTPMTFTPRMHAARRKAESDGMTMEDAYWREGRKLERDLRYLERKLAELTERWEKAANAYLIEKGRHEATQAKLAEAREALEWAQSQLGKHTRPSPIDKALARIDESDQIQPANK